MTTFLYNIKTKNMTMNKQILYILSLMGLLSFAACTNEDEPALSNETGEIRFSVVDTTAVEITTKASLDFDVNEFNVSLSRGDESIFPNRKYGDIAGTSITCSAGSGYLLTAESCTEAEAESANSGWGQARVYGAEAFEVLANESKEVTVTCGLANTSVEVEFGDYITSTYSTYSIEIHATDTPSRSFTFDERNHSFRTAYFNVGESGRDISIAVTLPYFENPYTKKFILQPSKSHKLSVKIDGDDTNTTVTLGITVDGELLEEITLKQNINPYE